ncbi:ABC transporter substrate-binding protein [Agromyces sp. SYSU T00194]|uniref:ABC transporter substrate-binding protein n=1 Tax=Agromyces chitinivorans TaxID=3158560 RepID=UPI003398BDD7
MRNQHQLAASVAALFATSLVITGCSGTDSASEGGEDGEITLTMAWWGNDTRSANTEAIIEAFQEEHPNVTIEPSYTDYGSYWDRLATQVAAGDTPDIMQFDEPYLTTYVDQGVLLDLTDYDIDTSAIPDATLDAGIIDGRLYTLASGVATYAIYLNPAIFEQAGIPVPDDPNWTWDEFEDTAVQLSEAGAGDYYGFASSFGFDEGSIRLWARQHGETLYTEDGGIGVSPETMESYFAFTADMIANGGSPSAATLSEGQGVGLSETFFATGSVGMGSFWNSQLTAVTDAVGNDLVMLPVPESVNDYFLKPAANWVGSAQTEHPEVVAEFIDFMVNSEAQADIQGTERGIPNNEDIREYLAPQLTPQDQAAIEFLDVVTFGSAAPATPPGGNQTLSILPRYTQEVIFETSTPAEAAAGFLDELQTALDDAQ